MTRNSLLPDGNRGGSSHDVAAPWDGDDQQWWSWYVTLAEPTPIEALVPGPPALTEPVLTDHEVVVALAEPYELPDDALTAFRRDECVRLPGVLPHGVVVRLADRLAQLLAAEHGESTAGEFLALEQMWLHDDLMRTVALSPRLGNLAAQLAGADVRLYHDNALSKEPGCGRTPWHHDAEHFPFTPAHAVTAWIPVGAIPAEMGPLSFAPGNGVPEVMADLAFDKVGTSYDAAVARRLAERGMPVVIEPYAAGDVSFHSSLAFHTAGPNRTTTPRRALATTYLADGLRVIDSPTMISGAWRDFVPGTAPGELVASPLNPVVGRFSPRPTTAS